MKKSQIFLLACLLFIIGVGLASFIKIDNFIVFVFVLGAMLAVICFKNKPHYRLFAIGALFLLSGIFRYNLNLLFAEQNQLTAYGGRSVNLEGKIDGEIKRRLNRQEIILQVYKIENNNTDAKVLITSELYPEYNYGDKLSVQCLLKAPQDGDTRFSYREYLARSNIYYTCYNPGIEKISSGVGGFYSFIFALKKNWRELLRKNIPEPVTGFIESLVLGDKSSMSPAQLQDFSLLGVSHIIAVSGLHLVILFEALAMLLIFFGLRRQQSFYYVLLFLLFYIILIGLPASAIRSLIILVFIFLAEQTGRLSRPFTGLAAAAALMLAVNPSFLRFDLGFQLSFLSITGILLFYQILKEKVKKWKIPNVLRDLVLVTIAAQITTLPIILYNFGNFNPLSVLSNVLIVPLVGFVMISGFLTAFLGFLPIIGPIFGIFTYLGGWYILKILNMLGQLGFLNYKLNFSFLAVFISYSAILLFCFIYFRGEISEFTRKIGQKA